MISCPSKCHPTGTLYDVVASASFVSQCANAVLASWLRSGASSAGKAGVDGQFGRSLAGVLPSYHDAATCTLKLIKLKIRQTRSELLPVSRHSYPRSQVDGCGL
eukprot:3934946-Rhodomonas_salina.3